MAKVSGHCFAYDLIKQTMRKMTPLNVVRYNHAACMIGPRLFVFGGRNNRNEQLATIEVCNIKNLSSDETEKSWDKFLLEQIEPRYNCVFCPVSKRELLILGGTDKGAREDAFIYDALNRSTRLVKSEIGH